MTRNVWKGSLKGPSIALSFAICGAVAGTLFGIPAPALLGATIATALASVLRLKPSVPTVLRNIGFAVIGGTLGSGITPSFYGDLLKYPISLASLTLCMGLTMLISGMVLMGLLNQTRKTAILATSPGALSYSIALATDTGQDVRTIMVLQSIRLLLITMMMPPLLTIFAETGAAAHADLPTLGLIASILILLLSALGGVALERFGMPAAWLLSGLLVSGLAHGSGFSVGRFIEPVTFIGFTLAGAVIGSRFAGISGAELKRLSFAGVISTVLAILLSALLAFFTCFFVDVPFAQMWIAFAPGGVEGMSAMALALDLDPVFVAIHHIYRILLLIAVLPILLRWG